MARELSLVQEYILTKAAAQPCVSYADILSEFYGWEPTGPATLHENGTLIRVRNRHFSPASIGAARYNTTRAGLSRSVARFMHRGLVRWFAGSQSHRAGIEITEAGRAYLLGGANEGAV